MTPYTTFFDNQLIWSPELGIGYYPVKDNPSEVYNLQYWTRYNDMKDTPIGKALTTARIDLVNTFSNNTSHIDLGIGCGDFVEQFNCYGDDVNPFAIAWLEDRECFRKLSLNEVDSISAWDVIEHIHDPTELFANVRKYVFLSMPIYTDSVHVMRSKHFRKDEHCWYPTHAGIQRFMKHFGFSMVHYDDRETVIGREDINSYVFLRDQ